VDDEAKTYYRVANGVHAFFAAFLVTDEEPVLATGFLAAGFFATAVFALVVELVPVTAFLAVPRFDGAAVFLAGTLFLPARVFLGAAEALSFEVGVSAVEAFATGFLVAAFAVPPDVVFLVAEAFGVVALVVVALVERELVGALTLDAGLAGLFSLEAEVSTGLAALGGSLTLPEGPFGRTKVPFSAPVAMALAN